MDKQKIDKAIREVAKRNGVSVEEVRREIEQAMMLAGRQVTAEEAVALVVERVEPPVDV